MPLICVAIVAYNSDATLPSCLAALAAQSCRDFEVIIVNNGLTPFLDTYQPPPSLRLRIVDPGKNLGFAAGNNLAASQAVVGTQWLAALNPDAYPRQDWLANFVAAADRYKDVTMFGSLQIEATRPGICDGMGDCYHIFGLAWRQGHGQPLPVEPTDMPVFSPCGAAAFYRLDSFRATGGFDEDYFCYFEDVDLAFRLRLRGERCLQLANVVVSHVGGASTTSAFALKHGLRNLIWTYLKNMPLLPALVFLLGLIVTVATLGLRHTLRGNGKAVWQAICEALCGFPAVWRKRETIQRNKMATTSQLLAAMTWLPGQPLRHLLRRQRNNYFKA